MGGIGCFLIYLGFQERGLAATANQVPEEISLKNLIARGPDGNPNVILTDYELCENIVYKPGKYGGWQNVWVPVVPIDETEEEPLPFPGANPPGKNPPGKNPGVPNDVQPAGVKPTVVRALIFTTHAHNEDELVRNCQKDKLPALVTNKISSIGYEEKKILEQQYPGTDWSRCLIIHEGREPAGVVKQTLLFGGGAALIFLAMVIPVVILIRSINQRPAPNRRRDDDDDRPRQRRGRRDNDDDDEFDVKRR
jgi:hypothetical protein